MNNMTVLDERAAGARRFEGRTALVTGGGQGIGRATARRLAQEAFPFVAEINPRLNRRKVASQNERRFLSLPAIVEPDLQH